MAEMTKTDSVEQFDKRETIGDNINKIFPCEWSVPLTNNKLLLPNDDGGENLLKSTSSAISPPLLDDHTTVVPTRDAGKDEIIHEEDGEHLKLSSMCQESEEKLYKDGICSQPNNATQSRLFNDNLSNLNNTKYIVDNLIPANVERKVSSPGNNKSTTENSALSVSDNCIIYTELSSSVNEAERCDESLNNSTTSVDNETRILPISDDKKHVPNDLSSSSPKASAPLRCKTNDDGCEMKINSDVTKIKDVTENKTLNSTFASMESEDDTDYETKRRLINEELAAMTKVDEEMDQSSTLDNGNCSDQLTTTFDESTDLSICEEKSLGEIKTSTTVEPCKIAHSASSDATDSQDISSSVGTLGKPSKVVTADRRDNTGKSGEDDEEKEEGELDEDEEEGEVAHKEEGEEDNDANKSAEVKENATTDVKIKTSAYARGSAASPEDKVPAVKVEDAMTDEASPASEKPPNKDDRKRKKKDEDETSAGEGKKNNKKKKQHHLNYDSGAEDSDHGPHKYRSRGGDADFDAMLQLEIMRRGGVVTSGYDSDGDASRPPKRRGGRRSPLPSSKTEALCVLFLEGTCDRGNSCQYSHNVNHKMVAQPHQRKMELCKFYMNKCCAKRQKCLYMHKDFPCKYFHTGMKCVSSDMCQFSHEPLSGVTRNILLKHLELAPKDILGLFPRLNRAAAIAIVQVTELVRKHQPVGPTLLQHVVDYKGFRFKYVDRALKAYQKEAAGKHDQPQQQTRKPFQEGDDIPPLMGDAENRIPPLLHPKQEGDGGEFPAPALDGSGPVGKGSRRGGQSPDPEGWREEGQPPSDGEDGEANGKRRRRHRRRHRSGYGEDDPSVGGEEGVGGESKRRPHDSHRHDNGRSSGGGGRSRNQEGSEHGGSHRRSHHHSIGSHHHHHKSSRRSRSRSPFRGSTSSPTAAADQQNSQMNTAVSGVDLNNGSMLELEIYKRLLLQQQQHQLRQAEGDDDLPGDEEASSIVGATGDLSPKRRQLTSSSDAKTTISPNAINNKDDIGRSPPKGLGRGPLQSLDDKPHHQPPWYSSEDETPAHDTSGKSPRLLMDLPETPELPSISSTNIPALIAQFKNNTARAAAKKAADVGLASSSLSSKDEALSLGTAIISSAESSPPRPSSSASNSSYDPLLMFRQQSQQLTKAGEQEEEERKQQKKHDQMLLHQQQMNSSLPLHMQHKNDRVPQPPLFDPSSSLPPAAAAIANDDIPNPYLKDRRLNRNRFGGDGSVSATPSPPPNALPTSSIGRDSSAPSSGSSGLLNLNLSNIDVPSDLAKVLSDLKNQSKMLPKLSEPSTSVPDNYPASAFPQYNRDPRNQLEPKNAKDFTELRDPRNSRDPRDFRSSPSSSVEENSDFSRDTRDPRQNKEPRENRDPRGSKPPSQLWGDRSDQPLPGPPESEDFRSMMSRDPRQSRDLQDDARNAWNSMDNFGQGGSFDRSVNLNDLRQSSSYRDPRLSSRDSILDPHNITGNGSNPLLRDRSQRSSSDSEDRSSVIGSLTADDTNNSADVDLKRLNMPASLAAFSVTGDMPFHVPVHAPVTVINASITAHPPITYRLTVVTVPRPNYSHMSSKIDKDDPRVQDDPRLQSLLGINVIVGPNASRSVSVYGGGDDPESPSPPPPLPQSLTPPLPVADSRDPRRKRDARPIDSRDPRGANKDPRYSNLAAPGILGDSRSFGELGDSNFDLRAAGPSRSLDSGFLPGGNNDPRLAGDPRMASGARNTDPRLGTSRDPRGTKTVDEEMIANMDPRQRGSILGSLPSQHSYPGMGQHPMAGGPQHMGMPGNILPQLGMPNIPGVYGPSPHDLPMSMPGPHMMNPYMPGYVPGQNMMNMMPHQQMGVNPGLMQGGMKGAGFAPGAGMVPQDHPMFNHQQGPGGPGRGMDAPRGDWPGFGGPPTGSFGSNSDPRLKKGMDQQSNFSPTPPLM